MNPCDTCAFRVGSVTHDDEVYNRFRAEIAGLSGVPFFCHHTHDYKKPFTIRRGMVIQDGIEPQRLTVCAGWKAQAAKDVPRGKEGWLNRTVRHALGRQALDTLDAAIAETGPAEKRELWAELRSIVLSLVKHSNFKIVRPL